MSEAKNSKADEISQKVISRLLENLGDESITPEAIKKAFSELGEEFGTDPEFMNQFKQMLIMRAKNTC
jgi:hypothetical protein